MCTRWLLPNGQGFRNFVKDMGARPEEMTLDRKEVNGDYRKSNCKWATRKEQSNNARSNILLSHKGKTQNIAQWAEELGLPRDRLYKRYQRGESTRKILAK